MITLSDLNVVILNQDKGQLSPQLVTNSNPVKQPPIEPVSDADRELTSLLTQHSLEREITKISPPKEKSKVINFPENSKVLTPLESKITSQSKECTKIPFPESTKDLSNIIPKTSITSKTTTKIPNILTGSIVSNVNLDSKLNVERQVEEKAPIQESTKASLDSDISKKSSVEESNGKLEKNVQEFFFWKSYN